MTGFAEAQVFENTSEVTRFREINFLAVRVSQRKLFTGTPGPDPKIRFDRRSVRQRPQRQWLTLKATATRQPPPARD